MTKSIFKSQTHQDTTYTGYYNNTTRTSATA